MATPKHPSSIPPVLSILRAEGAKATNSISDMTKLLKRGLYKELLLQAEGTAEGPGEEHPPSVLATGFVGFPAGGLDPLSAVGKCGNLACRVENSIAFANTIGLLCDAVYLPDVFTSFVENGTSFELMGRQLHESLLVYEVLHPLVEAGIIRLAHRRENRCLQCTHKEHPGLSTAVSNVTDQSLEEGSFIIESTTGGNVTIKLQIPVIHQDENLISRIVLRNSETKVLAGMRVSTGKRLTAKNAKKLRPWVNDLVNGWIYTLLAEMELAATTNSTLLAGSAEDARVLGSLHPLSPGNSARANWEKLRTLQLPWVSKLQPREIIELRQSADKALPRLRALLANKLSVKSTGSETVEAVASELKEQALQVESEIVAIGRRWPGVSLLTGVASMELVLYSLTQSANAALPAMGAVLATLAASHLEHSKKKSDLARQESTPGYVLLRAKQLLEHGTHS